MHDIGQLVGRENLFSDERLGSLSGRHRCCKASGVSVEVCRCNQKLVGRESTKYLLPSKLAPRSCRLHDHTASRTRLKSSEDLLLKLQDGKLQQHGGDGSSHGLNVESFLQAMGVGPRPFFKLNASCALLPFFPTSGVFVSSSAV